MADSLSDDEADSLGVVVDVGELQRSAHVRLYKQRLDAAAIPERYQFARMADMDKGLGQYAEKARAVKAMRSLIANGCIAQRGRDRMCLLLSGGFGTGKTTLATAGLKELIWRGKSGLWQKFYTFIRDVQRGYRDGSADDTLKAIQRVQALVLDDVGDLDLGKETQDKRQLLYEVLDYRNDHLLPTIITTNLSEAEMAAQFGERTMQRILEMCALFGMEGKNLRDAE